MDSHSYRVLVAQLVGLNLPNYATYLASDAWQRRREQWSREHRDERCFGCDRAWSQLHHRTYRRLGAEHDDDLVPLCDVCHWAVHVLSHDGESGVQLDDVGRLPAVWRTQDDRPAI